MRTLVRAELLWVWALIVTWLLFVVFNLAFDATTFAHLDRLPAPTFGELHRLGAAAGGASRHGDLTGPDPTARPKASFLPNVFVFRRRTLPDGCPDTRLPSSASVRTMYSLLRDEVAPTTKTSPTTGPAPKPTTPVQPPPASPEKVDVLQLPSREIQFFEQQLKLSRLKHAGPTTLEGQRKTLAKRANLLSRTDPLNGQHAELIRDTRSMLEKAEESLKKGKQERVITLGEPFPDGDKPRDAEYASYLSDLARLVPLDAQPPADPTAARNLMVAYYPPAVGATDSSAHEWVFLMEVEYRPSWWAESVLTARFRLIDQKQPDAPVINPRRHEVAVFTRGPGWLGFRPTAVLVSEEQLASLFVNQLEELAQGVGGVGTPTADERLRLQHFVHQLLLHRFGLLESHPSGTRASPPADPATFDHRSLADPTSTISHRRQMDEWVVWPRRLNGGTGWGVIQFAVVLLCVRFSFDAVLIWLAVRRVEQLPRLPGHPLVPDVWWPAYEAIADATNQASLRNAQKTLGRLIREQCHTLAAVNAILPLVGFLGTVAGLSNSLIGSTGVSSESTSERQAALQAMEIALGTAFDKSMLAFAGSIACTLALRWLHWRADNVKRQPDGPV